MIDEVLNFIYSNWQNIIVALAVGLLFYFLSNYAIKKYLTSAERERLNQAKNSLLDILEARIINKQDVSTDKINNLLKAIEREHSVALSDVVSSVSLLQDLEFRIEKSHHLDSAQKEDYCRRIQNQIQEIRDTEETLKLPSTYSEIVENLTEQIKSNNPDKALENLELLTEKIKERDEYTSGKYELSAPFRLMIMLDLIAITGLVLSYFSKGLIDFVKIFVIGFLVIVMLSIFVAFIFGMGKK